MYDISNNKSFVIRRPNMDDVAVTLNDSSTLYHKVMSSSELTLEFSLAEYVDFPIGSSCVFELEEYQLYYPSDVKVVNRRQYEYVLVFHGRSEVLKSFRIMNMVDFRLEFDYFAKPQEHLKLIVDNLSARYGDWEVGEYVAEEGKLISYNYTSCWDALTELANLYETEFDLEHTGDVWRINLRKKKHDRLHDDDLAVLRYGEGLVSGVSRSKDGDGMPPERLWVQGGDRNITLASYGSSQLLLPAPDTDYAKVWYDGEHWKWFDGERYVSDEGFLGENHPLTRCYVVHDAARRSIVNKSIRDNGFRTYAEDSIDLTDIYPMREGHITAVTYRKGGQIWDSFEEIPEEIRNADWSDDAYTRLFVDFVDDTIPDTEDGSDFYQRASEDEDMTITFQSGQLGGRSFEVTDYSQDGAVSGTKPRSFLIRRERQDDIVMPNQSFRAIPRSEDYEGDKYAVFGCKLPEHYIRMAEVEMLKKGAKYLYENEEHKFSFTGTLSKVWYRRNYAAVGGQLKVGSYVRFKDEAIAPEDGVVTRIVGLRQGINNPYDVTIELSNEVAAQSVGSLLSKLENQPVHTENLYKEAKTYTRRKTYAQSEEILGVIERTVEGFGEGISPATVRTMAMLVGSPELQFVFLKGNAYVSTSGVVHYDPDGRRLICDACTLEHKTVDITTMTSSAAQREYRRWTMDGFQSPYLGDGEAQYPYLLYAVVPIEGSGHGHFLPVRSSDEAKLPFRDEDGGVYNLFVGVLSSEVDGFRTFSPLNGFTEISPSQITSDRIESTEGRTYFDLLKGEIGGRINFMDGLISGSIGVGRDDSSIVAGMSGEGGDNPMIFAGVSRTPKVWYAWNDGLGHLVYSEALPSDGDGVIITYAEPSTDSSFFIMQVEDEDNIYEESTGASYRRYPDGNVSKSAGTDTATFRVFDDGRLMVGRESGRHILIEPSATNPSLSVFNDEGERSMLITGDKFGEDDLYSGTRPLTIQNPALAQERFTVYWDGSRVITDRIVLGDKSEFVLSGAGTVSFTYGMSCPIDSDNVSGAPVGVAVDLLLDGIVVHTVSGIGGVDGTGSSIAVNGIAVTRVLSAGTHSLQLRLRMSTRGNYAGECFVGAVTTSVTNASVNYVSRLSQYFANGFAVGYDAENYAEALLDDDNKLLFKAESGNAGIRLHDGTVSFKLNGVWYSLTRETTRGYVTLTPIV